MINSQVAWMKQRGVRAFAPQTYRKPRIPLSLHPGYVLTEALVLSEVEV